MAKKKYDNSGVKELFPETADVVAVLPVVGTESEQTITSSDYSGKSANEASSSRCPAPETDIASAALENESKQLVDSQKDDPEAPPRDLMSSFDETGDSNVPCDPSNDSKPLMEHSEPHGCTGGALTPVVDTARITSADVGPCQSFHHGPEDVAAAQTAAGPQPNGCKSFAASSNDSDDSSPLAASKDAEQASGLLKDAATEACEPVDNPQGEEEQPVVNDDTGAGLDRAGSSSTSADQAQTAQTTSVTGDSEIVENSKQTCQGASALGEASEARTPAPGNSKSNKCARFHPKVIDEEIDRLKESGREILARLKELNIEQHKVPQNYPSDEVQAGYADLKTANATCSKTASRDIRDLIDKGFIDRVKEGNEEGPGSPARYRIHPDDEVRKRRLDKRLTHYIEIGLGRKDVRDPEERDEHHG